MRMVPTNSMTNMYLKHGSRAGSISLAAVSSLYKSRFDPCSVSSLSQRESYSSRPRSASKESLTPFQEDFQNNQLSRRSSLATTTFGYVSDGQIMQEVTDLQENELNDNWHDATDYEDKVINTTKKHFNTTSKILNVKEMFSNGYHYETKSIDEDERLVYFSKLQTFKRQNRLLSPECKTVEETEDS